MLTIHIVRDYSSFSIILMAAISAFFSLFQLIEEVKYLCPCMPLILVGTKSDLMLKESEVDENWVLYQA